MLTISKSKLKAQMLQIFRNIEATGEELTITDRGRPVLRVIPIKEKVSVEEAFADVHGQLEFFEDPDAPTLDEWNEV